MYTTYSTPAGEYSRLYSNMLNAGHTLIAGATGSGKSTVLTGLIHTALYDSPAKARFVIIDPKRVDLIEYADLPHVERYATSVIQIQEALCYACVVMEARYKYMAQKRLKLYDGSTLFVVIDELADLMTFTDPFYRKDFVYRIQHLAQLGRAAKITLLCATQCCLSTVISSAIKCNFASRLALRTATAQDSRNILDVKGAETLPDPKTAGKAFGIWRHNADTTCYILPRYDDAERQRIIDHWHDRRNTRHSLFRKTA